MLGGAGKDLFLRNRNHSAFRASIRCRPKIISTLFALADPFAAVTLPFTPPHCDSNAREGNGDHGQQPIRHFEVPYHAAVGTLQSAEVDANEMETPQFPPFPVMAGLTAENRGRDTR